MRYVGCEELVEYVRCVCVWIGAAWVECEELVEYVRCVCVWLGAAWVEMG